MLIFLALILFLVLASPANSIVAAILLVAGVVEVGYWWRTVKHRRLQTGAEALIGARAKVVSACHPDGRVSLEGALWNAHCAGGGADAGDSVVVSGRDGLLLMVEPEPRA